MNQHIRVLIVNDHQLFTEAIAAVLNAHEEISLVGSTVHPDEAFQIIRFEVIHLVLLDVTMEQTDTVQVLRKLTEEFPELKVVVLGLYRDEDVLKFIEAGASGYILREARCSELLSTIKAVHEGQSPCSARVAATVFARITELSRKQSQRELVQHGDLTFREKEILSLIAKGLSNKEIAEQLHISMHTVKNHVHNILEKLKVHRRQEAIRCVYENSLLKRSGPIESSSEKGVLQHTSGKTHSPIFPEQDRFFATAANRGSK